MHAVHYPGWLMHARRPARVHSLKKLHAPRAQGGVASCCNWCYWSIQLQTCSVFNKLTLLYFTLLFVFSVHVRYMSSSVRPSVRLSVCLSVVCNVRAPYSGDWNFRQCFYVI